MFSNVQKMQILIGVEEQLHGAKMNLHTFQLGTPEIMKELENIIEKVEQEKMKIYKEWGVI